MVRTVDFDFFCEFEDSGYTFTSRFSKAQVSYSTGHNDAYVSGIQCLGYGSS